MLLWILLLLILNILDVINGHRRIIILRVKNNQETPVSQLVEIAPGSNLSLRCVLSSNTNISDPRVVWGRRSKDIQYTNEFDFYSLFEDKNEHFLDLQSQADKFGLKHFNNIKYSDSGSYFCMSFTYQVYKLIQIKVRRPTLKSCPDDKYTCISNGFCISSHYQCDGKLDCPDGSDEAVEVCGMNPCEDKLDCADGRCIPTSWCCDKLTDPSCRVDIRHHCCPHIPNPYDPLIWYTSDDYNKTKEVSRETGPRYLFIAVCVVSAILSFVLFLFVISKMCGFDKRPHARTSNNNNDNHSVPMPSICGHSECAIRQELTNPGGNCLYCTEVSDPLIDVNICSNNDLPPSYAEVVNKPPNIDKAVLEDLLNAPPPPYGSTKETSSNKENIHCDTNL